MGAIALMPQLDTHAAAGIITLGTALYKYNIALRHHVSNTTKYKWNLNIDELQRVEGNIIKETPL